MTEGTPPPPTDPEQPSVNEQKRDKSASRRSNEFWLAPAGIFATVLVGAETDRAAVQFTK